MSKRMFSYTLFLLCFTSLAIGKGKPSGGGNGGDGGASIDPNIVLAHTEDGRRGDSLHIGDYNNSSKIYSANGDIGEVQLSPNNDSVLVNDNDGLVLVSYSFSNGSYSSNSSQVIAQGYVPSMAYSPDGSKIAYSIDQNGETNTVIVDLSGNILASMKLDLYLKDMAWLSDNQLAYVTYSYDLDPATNRALSEELHLVEFDANYNVLSNIILLDTVDESYQDIQSLNANSAGDKLLVSVYEKSGSYNVYEYDMMSATQQLLVSGNEAAYSRDGSSVILIQPSRRNNELVEYDLSSGSESVLNSGNYQFIDTN